MAGEYLASCYATTVVIIRKNKNATDIPLIKQWAMRVNEEALTYVSSKEFDLIVKREIEKNMMNERYYNDKWDNCIKEMGDWNCQGLNC